MKIVQVIRAGGLENPFEWLKTVNRKTKHKNSPFRNPVAGGWSA